MGVGSKSTPRGTFSLALEGYLEFVEYPKYTSLLSGLLGVPGLSASGAEILSLRRLFR
jgi:hypothetical protein